MRVEQLRAGSKAFRARGVFYGWWLVGLTSFLLTLMSLTVFQGLGTMLVALERQYGWSRTALSGAFSLARVEGAILGPIEGVLVDRIGTRRMVLIGYALMGLGFIWLSRIESLGQLGLLPFTSLDESLLHFYGAYAFVSLGSGLGGWLALVAMVNNWFIRRRSFAMASAMSGIHLGGLLVPLFALAIERFGLDDVAMGIGVFMLVITGPAAKAIRNRPEDMGLRPDGDAGPAQETSAGERASGGADEYVADDEPDFTAWQALKTPAFWILTIAQVASSIAIVTLALHLVPKLTDTGMSLSAAGLVVTTYTLVALPTMFVSGYLADRLPKTLMIAFFLFIQSVGLLIIALFDSVALAYVFAFLYGAGFGGRSPLTTAIRGDYFGRKAFATIMGISQLPMNVAMIFAPLFAGYMFDTTGTYVVPFTTFAALSFLGAAMMLFVRKPKQG